MIVGTLPSNDYLSRIDIPLLSEKFDASMILLRRRMNWDYKDIYYKRYGRHRPREALTEAGIQRLLSPEVNLGELLLYEAMNESWHRQPEVLEEDFWEEVSFFGCVHEPFHLYLKIGEASFISQL